MEVQEEAMAIRSNSKDQSLINMAIKGKRTKRQRPNFPLVLTMKATTSSSSSTAEGGSSTGDNNGGNYSDLLSTSPSYSGTETESTEEEEDMANCLILLAKSAAQSTRKSTSELPRCVTDNKPRVYAYQCKTCERCFPSFQALGGHRASHKKPNNNAEDHKKPLMTTAACLKEKEDVHHHHQFINIENKETCTALSLQISTSSATTVSCINNNNIKSSKVHECSTCGAEFSSGQALGGHMRRHRPMPPVAAAGISNTEEFHEGKKSRNLFPLDLNLPAPEEDHHHHHESKFPFSSKQQVIVFSASPLVDCHY